jgi:hypothetical protein
MMEDGDELIVLRVVTLEMNSTCDVCDRSHYYIIKLSYSYR